VKAKGFDYVIVGGGSAGCLLANRLSQDPEASACLLEAGPSDDTWLTRVPFALLLLMRSRQRNWCFYTEPQEHLAGRRLFWPRGRTLGGSSSINAMCYTRGHPADYDRWASLGNRGWGYREVLPYFMDDENREKGGTPYHGTGGPLNVAELRYKSSLGGACLEAALEQGFPLEEDFSRPGAEGVGFYEVYQKGGERWSNARAFLDPARGRPNLTVVTEARVTGLLVENGHCRGVSYRTREGAQEITAGREVVLCAGAVNTPQILLLSGIGPADDLRRLGLPVVLDLPGVGRNLQDHLDILLVDMARTHEGVSGHPSFWPRAVRGVLDYRRSRTGIFTSNLAEAGGFLRSSPDEPIADLQFHFLPGIQEEHGRRVRNMALHYGYSLHVCYLRPHSRGHVGLKTTDPLDDPLIQPNYLGDRRDLDRLVVGFRIAQKILASKAFDRHRDRPLSPTRRLVSDDEIRAHIFRKAETIYHPVGTCRMGSDEMAVVDDTLQVRGIRGLRIADASVMPELVGGNTNAPTTMIAAKAASIILDREESPPPSSPVP
jgi:choline dehydrogenase